MLSWVSHLHLWISMCVCAGGSYANKCTEFAVCVVILSRPLFDKAADTATPYCSRARHCSWPTSLSLLLWGRPGSFYVLCVGVHVRLYLHKADDITVWNCTEHVLFSPKGKLLIPRMCVKSHLHPPLLSAPSFDWSVLLWTSSPTAKYETPENICAHISLVWIGSSLFLRWDSSCRRCGIYSACLFPSSKPVSSGPQSAAAFEPRPIPWLQPWVLTQSHWEA